VDDKPGSWVRRLGADDRTRYDHACSDQTWQEFTERLGPSAAAWSVAAAAVTAELYFGHADQDESLPPRADRTPQQGSDAAGVRYRAEVYTGAFHSYTQADFAKFGRYNAKATERHWRELVALFDRTCARPQLGIQTRSTETNRGVAMPIIDVDLPEGVIAAARREQLALDLGTPCSQPKGCPRGDRFFPARPSTCTPCRTELSTRSRAPTPRPGFGSA
jgi:hypothetical protein